MNTKLLHVSDTHLGYQQYHKPEREEDFKRAFASVITDAIQKNVDAVVHAGDLFHRSRPGIGTLSSLVQELQRLNQHDIPFYTIVGNHDSTREREWPSFLEDLGLGTYLGKEGDVIGGVTLYGQDYVNKHQRAKIEYAFEQPKTSQTALVSHGLFKPFPHGDWDLHELMAKSSIEFNAILLGDDHTPQKRLIEDTVVTYAGSTERTSADQREQRRYNIVEFTGDDVSVTEHTIDTRPFTYIDVELSDGEGVDTVIDKVEEKNILDDSVVIVTISGKGKRVPPGDVERVGNRCGALVTRVNDLRTFEDDIEAYSSVSLTGPDEAVQDRKSKLSLSPMGSDLEEIARETDRPKSRLKEETKQTVKEQVSTGDYEDFRTPNDIHTQNDTNENHVQEESTGEMTEDKETTVTEADSAKKTNENEDDGETRNTSTGRQLDLTEVEE